MLKDNRTIKRFSEGFKLKILSELSKGKNNKKEISRIYCLSEATINRWIHKYGRQDLLNSRITIESMDDINKIKALEKEIAQLKELLIKKDLDSLVVNSYLEVAAHKLGYKNVEELKKKLDIKP
jgi:transposase-like protein